MSKNLEILAEWLTEKKQSLGIVTGKVISINPIRIQYGDRVILNQANLRFTNSLINGYQGEYTDDNGTSVITKQATVRAELAVGDQVMMIPDNNNKIWYVIDKVVRV